MSYLGNFNDTLAFAAQYFVNLGWSVIPLCGDDNLARAKAPALPRWTQYQRRQPDPATLDQWFSTATQNPHKAMGIVLGRVSGLVVLDIDDPDVAKAFAEVCPDLTHTLTITSGNRGLPHYYFAVPDGLHVAGRTVAGCELRSDGQYVVAPGSIMGGCEWRVTHDVAPQILTERDLRRVLRFMQSAAHPTQQKPAERTTVPNSLPVDSTQHVNDETEDLTAAVLIAFYRSLAPKIGRNNALFRAGCFARDFGWSQTQVMAILQDVHANEQSIGQTKLESLGSRLAEAARTVASVFTRTGRKIHNTVKGLPNAIREWLLQHKLVNVARVLDGLVLAGFKAGQKIRVSSAYDALKVYGIGRQTLIKVLSVMIDTPPPSPPSYANAANWPDGQIKQCLFDRVAKPTKNRGRPAVVYVIPDIDQLVQRLGIDPETVKGGDTLQPGDLVSPAVYRAALHKALLRRAPGCYPRQWLAKRLGVSKDSCRRYEKQAGIYAQPNFNTWAITWENVQAILPERPEFGQFLEDNTGRRFPPEVAIAKMLMRAGYTVTFKAQGANHYSVAFAHADAVVVDQQAVVEKSQQAAPVPWAKNVVLPASDMPVQHELNGIENPKTQICCGPQHSQEQTAMSVADRNITSDADHKPPHSEHQMQRCADRLYQQLKAMSSAHSLTRKRTQSLVETYGVTLINRALWVLRKRENIRNPAGFLLTWLRSEGAVKSDAMLRAAT